MVHLLHLVFVGIKNVLEREIERHLVDTVRASGGRAYKWVSPGSVGVPDRLVILPGGRICAVECKAPGKTPTTHQARAIADLRGLGLNVLVVDNCEEIDRLFGATKR